VYASCFDANDTADASQIEQIIITRQMNPLSFIEGAIGMSQFPLYTARKNGAGFSNVQAAQSSISTSAESLSNTITTAAASIGGVGVVLAIGAVFFYFAMSKK
jgi:hypothetical protein